MNEIELLKQIADTLSVMHWALLGIHISIVCLMVIVFFKE